MWVKSSSYSQQQIKNRCLSYLNVVLQLKENMGYDQRLYNVLSKVNSVFINLVLLNCFLGSWRQPRPSWRKGQKGSTWSQGNLQQCLTKSVNLTFHCWLTYNQRFSFLNTKKRALTLNCNLCIKKHFYGLKNCLLHIWSPSIFFFFLTMFVCAFEGRAWRPWTQGCCWIRRSSWRACKNQIF